jgi:geranylgeranyl pyrophosphate synthase
VRIGGELAGTDWAVVQPFAFAAELFIASGLTADDVIDGADSRSGEPTLYSEKGAARSVLIAEWLHAIAQIILWETPEGVSAARWRKAVERFHTTYTSFFFFQYLESDEEGNPSVTPAQVDRLARGRTGMLLETCLTSPAIVAGDDRLAESLSDCGRWLGMAFQHRDDILDFIAEPTVLGKPVLLDLLSGQPNLVLAHALARDVDQFAHDAVRGNFAAARTDRHTLARAQCIQQEVLAALRATGSLSYASQVVRDYCQRAVSAIAGVTPSSAKRELLELIASVGRIDFPWEDE